MGVPRCSDKIRTVIESPIFKCWMGSKYIGFSQKWECARQNCPFNLLADICCQWKVPTPTWDANPPVMAHAYKHRTHAIKKIKDPPEPQLFNVAARPGRVRQSISGDPSNAPLDSTPQTEL